MITDAQGGKPSRTGIPSRPGPPPPARGEGGQGQGQQRMAVDLNKILEGLGTCHQIIATEEVISLGLKN